MRSLGIVPASYDERARRDLARAFPANIPPDWDFVERFIDDQLVRLVAVERDGDRLMTAALTAGSDFFGTYGCVAAAAGDCPGVNLTDATLPLWESLFRAGGFDWSKIVTARPGLARKLDAAGYRRAGEIFLKPLVH